MDLDLLAWEVEVAKPNFYMIFALFSFPKYEESALFERDTHMLLHFLVLMQMHRKSIW